MLRQKSFENENPTLYLVATPIGNLEEVSSRAVNVLTNVDVIACEDTRTSRTFLDHYDIHTKLITYHNFNEEESSRGILELLDSGKNIALISDAGYPLISDPGYTLVNRAIEEGFNVVTISGPSAGLHALVASGLPTRHYLFYGFLNEKLSKAKKELEQLTQFPYTMLFYESPHRIEDTLQADYEFFGDRKSCLARELTKKHEEYIRGTLKEFSSLTDLRGEMVLMIEGFHQEDVAVDYGSIKLTIDQFIAEGMTSKDAIKKVSKELGISKNDVYREYHSLANKD